MTGTDESTVEDREALVEPAYWAALAGFVAFGTMSWTSHHGYPQASSLFGALFVGCYLGGLVYLVVVSERSPHLSSAGGGS